MISDLQEDTAPALRYVSITMRFQKPRDSNLMKWNSVSTNYFKAIKQQKERAVRLMHIKKRIYMNE
jgi:hypothetical protein